MYKKKLKLLKPICFSLVFSLLCKTQMQASTIKDSLHLFVHHSLQLNYMGPHIGVAKKITSKLEVGLGIYCYVHYRNDYRHLSNSSGLNIWGRYYHQDFFAGLSLCNGRTPYLRALDQQRVYIYKPDLMLNMGYRQKLSKRYYLDFWAGYNVLQKSYSFHSNAFSLWAGVGKKLFTR